MRIKLSANSPLPPFRAWYPIHVQGSIASLKNTLCSSLSTLHGIDPSSLQLSIDGFELLDGSDLSVLRDGDLVQVDLVDAPSRATVSFIATPSVGSTRAVRQPVFQNAEPGPSTTRKRKRSVSTPTSSSNSTSDTESTSSASESDSDEDDTDSDEDEDTSDSESDSDTSESNPEPESSPPPIESIAQIALALHREERRKSKPPQPQTVVPQTFVAPGYGKPQTRARNLRRRLKRQHEHEAASAFAPSISVPFTGANAVVPRTDRIPQRETSTPTAPDVGWDANSPLNLPSMSLRNKNKAKNFKSLIGKPLPPKIIFADEEAGVTASTSAVATPDLSKSATPVTVDRQATETRPRLIPPSSRSSLPSNLFVTSIDVEAGMRGNRKKRRMRVEYGEGLDKDRGATADEDGRDISLDYGEADAGTVDVVPSNLQECQMDVDALESKANKRWSTLEKLTDKQQAVTGCIVGYKALGIDPVTHTPEYLLTLVGVVNLVGESMIVRPLRASAEISFGGSAMENEEGVGEEEHTWNDIVDGDWRVVLRV